MHQKINDLSDDTLFVQAIRPGLLVWMAHASWGTVFAMELSQELRLFRNSLNRNSFGIRFFYSNARDSLVAAIQAINRLRVKDFTWKAGIHVV